jgi:hypothetical protein
MDSTQLLRSYVSLLVEKVRSKKGTSKGAWGDRFSMQKFKSLGSSQEMLEYADNFLDRMGQGSARAAYVYSSRFALKVALNDKGTAQNQAEVDVYTNPQTKHVVTGIHGSDPEYRWIISDLVEPMRSAQEFEQLTGIKWTRYMEYITNAIKHGTNDPGAPPFVKSVIQTIRSNSLGRGDLASDDSYEHYGKTPDGRVVILDYGFTREVFDKHYSTSSEKTKAENPKTAQKTRVEKPKSPEKQQDDARTAVEPAARRR